MSAPATTISFATAYRQLRPSEKAFVDAYVQDVERAAQRANERISLVLYRGIDPAVVAASGGMLERPMVLAAISERINQIAADNELTGHRVIKEVMAMAFSNLGDYGDAAEDGTWSWDLAKCTPEQLSAIKTIKVEYDPRNPNMVRKQEITLHDKMGAIDKLMQYMGLNQADNPHWRDDNARPATAAITDNMPVNAAGDLYGSMIN